MRVSDPESRLSTVWWPRCAALAVTLLTCVLFAASASGQEDSTRALKSKLRVIEIEKQLVGMAPRNQSTEQRLDVIEIRLFGAAAQGDLFARLQRIERALVTQEGEPKTGAGGASKAVAAVPVAEEEEEEEEEGPIAAVSSGAGKGSGSPTPLIPSVAQLTAGGMDAMPGVKKPDPPKVLKSSVTTTMEFKKTDSDICQDANKLLTSGKYTTALKLFKDLARRNPKEPSYVYGAGLCYRQMGQPYDAFAEFVIAWHLSGSDSSMYHSVAEGMMPELTARIDDSFKLTYGFSAQDPEAVLNAGTRMWKAGLTKEAVRLFSWALKNEPLYANVAAYNLGACAEYGGDYKKAKGYYDYAASYAHRLEATLMRGHADSRLIRNSLERVSTYYIEQARADVQQKILKGQVRSWNGWAQAVSLPQSWGSEVCPFCAISRTAREYQIGRSAP